MKSLMFLLALGLVSSDKLDRTYLPPPGSKLSGGSDGAIQIPLEFPKESYSTTTKPSSGLPISPEDTHLTVGIDRGTSFVPGRPQTGPSSTPAPDTSSSPFQSTYKVPTTTTSYAFTQTTTFPPVEGFETTVSPIGPTPGFPGVIQQGPGQVNYPPPSIQGQQVFPGQVVQQNQPTLPGLISNVQQGYPNQPSVPGGELFHGYPNQPQYQNVSQYPQNVISGFPSTVSPTPGSPVLPGQGQTTQYLGVPSPTQSIGQQRPFPQGLPQIYQPGLGNVVQGQIQQQPGQRPTQTIAQGVPSTPAPYFYNPPSAPGTINIPGQQILPNQQGQFLPGQQGQFIPGQQGQIIPVQQNQIIPGQQSLFLPGQQGQIAPGLQGQILPGQQGLILPGQQGQIIPGTQGQIASGRYGLNLPGQQGQIAPGQQGQITPGQQGLILPGQQGQITPGTQGQITPGRYGLNLPGQQGQIAPGQQGQIIPGQQGLILPGQQGQITPGTQGQIAPGQQGQIIPGQQGLTLPGQQGQITPGIQGQIRPGQYGLNLPGQQGQIAPGQQGQIIPGQQGLILPGQQGQITPGTQGQITAGQQGLNLPGQQGQIIPGQQGQIAPGQQGQIIPGQQGLILPGQDGQITPGAQPQILPGQQGLSGQQGQFIPSQQQQGQIAPGQQYQVIPGQEPLSRPGQRPFGQVGVPSAGTQNLYRPEPVQPSTIAPFPSTATSKFPSYGTTSANAYSSTTPRYPGAQANLPQSGAVIRPERPQAESDRNAVILNYENVLTPEGYSYSYDTSNGIHADESGIATDGVKALGEFSYTGDDGQVYSVIYSADENGFLPRGDHLPTPPPVPEAIQRVIEMAEKDKEAGIYHDGSYDEAKYGHEKYQRPKNRNRPSAQGQEVTNDDYKPATLRGQYDMDKNKKPFQKSDGARKPITKTEDYSEDNEEADNRRGPGITKGEGKKGVFTQPGYSRRPSGGSSLRVESDDNEERYGDDQEGPTKYRPTSNRRPTVPGRKPAAGQSTSDDQVENQMIDKNGFDDNRRPTSTGKLPSQSGDKYDSDDSSYDTQTATGRPDSNRRPGYNNRDENRPSSTGKFPSQNGGKYDSDDSSYDTQTATGRPGSNRRPGYNNRDENRPSSTGKFPSQSGGKYDSDDSSYDTQTATGRPDSNRRPGYNNRDEYRPSSTGKLPSQSGGKYDSDDSTYDTQTATGRPDSNRRPGYNNRDENRPSSTGKLPSQSSGKHDSVDSSYDTQTATGRPDSNRRPGYNNRDENRPSSTGKLPSQSGGKYDSDDSSYDTQTATGRPDSNRRPGYNNRDENRPSSTGKLPSQSGGKYDSDDSSYNKQTVTGRPIGNKRPGSTSKYSEVTDDQELDSYLGDNGEEVTGTGPGKRPLSSKPKRPIYPGSSSNVGNMFDDESSVPVGSELYDDNIDNISSDIAFNDQDKRRPSQGSKMAVKQQKMKPGTGYQYIPPKTKFGHPQKDRFSTMFTETSEGPRKSYDTDKSTAKPFITPNVYNDEEETSDETDVHNVSSTRPSGTPTSKVKYGHPGADNKDYIEIEPDYEQDLDDKEETLIGSRPSQPGGNRFSSTRQPTYVQSTTGRPINEEKYTSSTPGRPVPKRPTQVTGSRYVPKEKFGDKSTFETSPDGSPDQPSHSRKPSSESRNEYQPRGGNYGTDSSSQRPGSQSTLPSRRPGDRTPSYGSRQPSDKSVTEYDENTTELEPDMIRSGVSKTPFSTTLRPGYDRTNAPEYTRPGSQTSLEYGDDGIVTSVTGRPGTRPSGRPGFTNVPSTTYRPGYTFTDGTNQSEQPGIVVDGFGRPISPQPGNQFAGSTTLRPGYAGTSTSSPVIGSYTPTGSLAYPTRDGYPKGEVTQNFQTNEPQFGHTDFGSTQGPYVDRGSGKYTPTTGRQDPYQTGQSTTEKIIGEDFSGPKRPQGFDPKYGYYY